MRALETNLLDWQKRYGTEEACAQALMQQRWPEGFRCPRRGHDQGYDISTRHCSQCHYQTSLTAGTLLHSTNLSLTKWFWAIYLSASEKGGISAVRLSKQIQVSWVTACRIMDIAIGNLKTFLLGTYHGVSSSICKSISMNSATVSTDVCGRASYRYAFSMLA